VPYIDKYLDQSDVEGMYVPRTPRTAVVDSIVADLQFAAANLRSISRSKTLGDANVVSAEVAWAFLARVALYEGTWAKYVEGDAARGEELLQIALEAAGKIVGNNNFSLTRCIRISTVLWISQRIRRCCSIRHTILESLPIR
jgi:hypothetical protein